MHNSFESDSSPCSSLNAFFSATTLNRISTANFPDSVLREVMKLDKNHDGYIDRYELYLVCECKKYKH